MGMSWTAFLLTYLFGGVTFIPLAIAIVLFHAHYTFPVRDENTTGNDGNDPDGIVQPGDDTTALREAQKEESKQRLLAESDVAAGYFAVCREYTPMGINAKPIERATPVGSATVAAPSPSVYQTMYRSIFDRKQTPGPLDDNKNVSQRPKKAGNVFYVVLRHGHLMLFDDDEQLEVRHVISLAHHDISIYSGGDPTPEGELFIKRNALCLSRKTDGKELTPDTQISKPFFLFSENCSAKEDFYFALLRNQEQTFTGQNLAPKPQRFEVKNIISLVQKLHSSEDHLQTRWLNAFIGRIFLGLYKTKDVENLIREKITKKISRVKRPSFLSKIALRNIDTGDSAPYFTNPRLKDLSVEGECGMEADVKYTGNFRLEVAATARIDLGPRFKVREVNLILAVVLRRLEGHIFFKIKPPPSNRIWFSFQSMPKIEMTIEPIVSSRQITYTVILRQIENRIKEVVAETLVNPFWDDIPFFNTEHKQWRGGIFEGDDEVQRSPDHEAIAAQLGNVDEVSRMEENGTTPATPATPPELPSLEKSHSVPVMETSQTNQTNQSQGFWSRKLNSKKSLQNDINPSASASTTALDTKSPRSSATDVLKPSRSGSISASSPIVSTDPIHADTFRPSSSPPDRDDAFNAIASISARSKNSSPTHTPLGSPARTSSTTQAGSVSASSSSEVIPEVREEEQTPTAPARRHTASSAESMEGDTVTPGSLAPSSSRNSIKSGTGSIGRGFFMRREGTASPAGSTNGGTPEGKRNTLAAVSNAAATAKRWGLSAIQRQTDRNGGPNGRKLSDPPVDLNQPMGRGQPLPPPGTPLPGPGKKAVPMAVPKRKPVVPPPSLPRQSSGNLLNEATAKIERRQVPPPPLPTRRRRVSQIHSGNDGSNDDNVLVVEAPTTDSEPNSPLIQVIGPHHEDENDHEDSTTSYMQPWVEDAEELDGQGDDDGGSEDLIEMTPDEEGSSPGGTPPELPPRHADAVAEVGEQSEQQNQKQKQNNGEQQQQEVEAEEEDGYSNWMDNPGFESPPDTNVSAQAISAGAAK
ncbi:uncharacterized protein F4822DRAFT_425149 [Hypoxylon trugodes]|uniref:uncharacterized protein n=1 Tax=Hypoxylon trugodes TaxID=326681 RepID=UPI00218F5707|nr:uncharacterized protein F4822DRAFT_425149 [Hypoxylon trugodes]KAI1391930.1 hypothetical protein F4822DRAFT_425149 [Hypoxylon trugodes]